MEPRSEAGMICPSERNPDNTPCRASFIMEASGRRADIRCGSFLKPNLVLNVVVGWRSIRGPRGACRNRGRRSFLRYRAFEPVIFRWPLGNDVVAILGVWRAHWVPSWFWESSLLPQFMKCVSYSFSVAHIIVASLPGQRNAVTEIIRNTTTNIQSRNETQPHAAVCGM